MKVSLNSIKRFTDVSLSVDELVARINQQLGGVEATADLGAQYQGAVIVKVEACEKHANADKLNVCQVNDGTGELTQVVCGAPNVHAGMFAVWLKPGSVVPSTAEDAEPFVLGARELRGVMSNGMLASPKELGLGDSHDGILEIDPSEPIHDGGQVAAGMSFAEAFGLDDTTIDIENKMFTHRPDLFGQLGVAREIAGILHQPFKSPDWYASASAEVPGIADDALDLAVFNDAEGKVPRLVCVVVKDITVRPSPVWLQAELRRLGGKPINNIVDATNYIMLLTAQPTHAYDYDKLRGHKLGARMARDGEAVRLLNGKAYSLTTDDIVIADADGPVGLGGVMGGGDSEVSEDTKNIVLEVANFDMYTVRKSSMRHGVFTDALTRFNKGQSPLQNPVIMAQLLRTIQQVAGGQVASQTYDLHSETGGERTAFVSTGFINERLGLKLGRKDIETILSNVEFHICESCDQPDHADDVVHYGVPFWRTDIELPEDIVEEVGRLYGFDKLPRELPKRTTKAAAKNHRRALKQSVRDSLRRAGANEALTYSFVHEKILINSDYGTEGAYALSNALSPDLQYYRLNVLPSLLDKVHSNIKSGHDEFVLFELGKGHDKGLDADDEGLPREREYLSAIYAAKKPRDGAAFYMMRRLIDQLAADLGVELEYRRNEFPESTRLFEPARSALVSDVKTGTMLGIIGEIKQSVAKKFKLPAYSAAVTLDFDSLSEVAAKASRGYQPLSRYPSISQDLSLKIAADVDYRGLLQSAQAALAGLDGTFVASVGPIGIYQPDDEPTKTVTFRLNVTNYERTLTDDAVRPIIDAIAKNAAEAFNATVV